MMIRLSAQTIRFREVTNAKIILEKGSNIKAGGSVVMKAVSSQKNNLVPFVEGANIINVKIGNAVISILGNIEAGGAVEEQLLPQ